MGKIIDGLSDEVSILNQRLIYLNELRVSVGRSYLIAVGIIFAAAGAVEGGKLYPLLRLGGPTLLVLGLFVLAFDIGMRARVAAVARAIRARTESSSKRDRLPLLVQAASWLQEDFFSASLSEA